MLQWHCIRQIFSHIKTHSDPEKVRTLRRIHFYLFYFYFLVLLTNFNINNLCFCVNAQLLPTVPTCGGGQHGLWEIPAIWSDAPHPRHTHHSLRAAVLCEGVPLIFSSNFYMSTLTDFIILSMFVNIFFKLISLVLRMWLAVFASILDASLKVMWAGPMAGCLSNAALCQTMERDRAPVWLLRWWKSRDWHFHCCQK